MSGTCAQREDRLLALRSAGAAAWCRALFMTALLVLCAPQAHALDPSDLLEPEQASTGY